MHAKTAERSHSGLTMRQYMTPGPWTVAQNQSLSTARSLMLQHHVRHLPVLHGGAIVGLVSERDLLMVESLPAVNPTEVRVEEAMVQSAYAVPADAPLGEVVHTMIDRKLGSAVVTDEGSVLGVFTTIDALRALADLLEGR